MKLAELAEHSINIEYPGRDLESALDEARERSSDALQTLRSIEEQILNLTHQAYDAEAQYFQASREANLFENALGLRDDQ